MKLLHFPKRSMMKRLQLLSITLFGTLAAVVQTSAETFPVDELDVNGNTIFFGSWPAPSDQPAVSFHHVDDPLKGTLELRIARSTGEWLWRHAVPTGPDNGFIPAMRLDAGHRLHLLDSVTSAVTTGIILDPIGSTTLFPRPVTFSANSTFIGTNNLMPNQIVSPNPGLILTRSLADGLYLTRSIADTLYPSKLLFSLNTGATTAPTATGTAAVAFGSETAATNSHSAAFGRGTIANAANMFAVGSYNSWAGSEGLFSIGNGTSNTNRSNAFSVSTNGTTTIAGELHVATLRHYGGTITSATNMVVPSLTATNRLTSAGLANGYFSSPPSLGSFAMASGYSPSATGFGAAAVGGGTASGSSSFATGAGDASTIRAFAANSGAASGTDAAAFGIGTTARAFASVAFGHYNAFNSGESPTVWNDGEALFVVGNGTSTTRKNAMLMKKNGATAIGLGVTTSIASQVVVGKYNDTTNTVDPLVNKTQGVFIVGAGSGVPNNPNGIPQTQNALRVLDDGSVLVQAKGDLSMGTFTAGTAP